MLCTKSMPCATVMMSSTAAGVCGVGVPQRRGILSPSETEQRLQTGSDMMSASDALP